MTDFFKANKASNAPETNLDVMVNGIQKLYNVSPEPFTAGTATRVLSMEGFSEPSVLKRVNDEVTNMAVSLEGIASPEVLKRMTAAQKAAAAFTSLITTNIQGYLKHPVSKQVLATENMAVITAHAGDTMTTRPELAMEAYDEKDNRTTTVYSIAYNMNAAQQDEFAETLFPTITVSPDQNGLVVSVRLMEVFTGIKRSITGAIDKFNRKNIIKAVIDPTILHNDANKIVPVVRAGNESKFVDASLLAARDILLDGQTIHTSALAIGARLSLLGISQTDALLDTGTMDQTDAVDTALSLKTIYIKFVNGANTDVLAFNVSRTATSIFVPAQQGLHRAMQLNFNTNSLQINASTKTASNGALVSLAPIVAGNYSVRIGTRVNGEINLEDSNIELDASKNVVVNAITNPAGDLIDIAVGAGATIAALFANASVIGYELNAQRTNSNLRQIDQLVSTSYYNQMYTVALRSPISIQRPPQTDGTNDTADLATLITTTRIRTSNAAVDELFNASDILAQYVGNRDAYDQVPEILGAARWLIAAPFYEQIDLNVNEVINSISSHERASDTQAVLVNQIRDVAFRMYRDSGYKAAADAMAGGISGTPTVIIATDPVIARYLMVDGDLRTVGADFNVKVVSTLNNRMSGKIFVTFGDFNTANQNTPNPLHFGCMAWKPELTLILPIHRQGSNSKQLSVTPSFQHIVNCPILARIDVTGIPDTMSNNVAINFRNVP